MMKELQYPFDPDYIMTNKKKIKRLLLENQDDMVDKRIAILGGFTTKDIMLTLELFLLDNKIRPTFYESEYNKFYEDAVFENQSLDEFNPDLIYICTCNRNINGYPNIFNTNYEIDTLVYNEFNRFRTIWDSIKNKYNVPIIQNNFEMPFYRLLGNKDVSDIHGKTNFISRLNMKFNEYAESNSNFYICDYNYISADYGLNNWFDMSAYYMFKYALNVSAIPYLSYNVSNIIKSIFGKNKKGFVLDLDNTLWGGVIGDDGVENIVLGEEVAEGEAYLEFQRYLKENKELGVVLNIDSKNDERNAFLGLEHPNSVLKRDDFIDIKANWEPKDKNFIEIANDLSLGQDSLLFVDDNPAERHIVTEQIKGVVAPNIGEVSEYIKNIDRGGYFEVTSISKDDLHRNEMYKENIERAKLESTFKDYSDYLKSLDMHGIIKQFEPIHFSRISQLTNKSNQFNLTTKRFTKSEIENMSHDSNFITLYGDLKDKFGDNGIVSLAIGKIEDEKCHMILWLMSCRVLKRDMEFAMMDEMVLKCKNRGVKEIIGYYYPTVKNHMVNTFYDNQGFVLISEDEKGNKIYILKIDDYVNKNKVIKINE